MRRQIIAYLLILALTIGGITSGFHGAAWLHANTTMLDAPGDAAALLAAQSTPSQSWRTRVPWQPPPTATPKPTATERPSATPRATATATPRPSATATRLPASPTPTAEAQTTRTIQATATPPAPTPLIVGSPAFTQDIREGLALMARVSPTDAEIVRQWVGEIRESQRNYSTSGSRTIEISTTAAGFSVPYAGAIVLHEAVHVRASYTGQVPVWGCKGEERSLRAQAAYLRKAGDEALARWSESLIGTWC